MLPLLLLMERCAAETVFSDFVRRPCCSHSSRLQNPRPVLHCRPLSGALTWSIGQVLWWDGWDHCQPLSRRPMGTPCRSSSVQAPGGPPRPSAQVLAEHLHGQSGSSPVGLGGEAGLETWPGGRS